MGDVNYNGQEQGGLAHPHAGKPVSRREAELAAAGLPGASEAGEHNLHRDGIDPDQLSSIKFGRPAALLRYPYPPGFPDPSTALKALPGNLEWADTECIYRLTCY